MLTFSEALNKSNLKKGRLVTKAQGLHRKTQWQSMHKLNSKNYCFWFVTKAQGLHY